MYLLWLRITKGNIMKKAFIFILLVGITYSQNVLNQIDTDNRELIRLEARFKAIEDEMLDKEAYTLLIALRVGSGITNEIFYIFTQLYIIESLSLISRNDECSRVENMTKGYSLQAKQDLRERIDSLIDHLDNLKRFFTGADLVIINDLHKFSNELMERYKL